MKKYLLSILIICLSLLVFVGCGSTDTTTTTDTTTDEDTEMTSDLKDEIVGEWQATGYKDDFEYDGVTYTGDDSFTYTFKKDGTYTLVIASTEKAEGSDDVSSGQLNVAGDYTVDNDEDITLSVTTINGQDRETYTAENPDNVDVVFFEDATLSAEIKGDKLELSSEEMSLTLKKVEN